MHKFIFGIFCKGKLVMSIGKPVECSHNQAAVIVALLSGIHDTLEPGHYIACGYR